MEISSEDFNNNSNKSSLRLIETYYKIQKIIGKGAFGVVYKAFELYSGHIVAIKKIPVDEHNKKHVIKEIELLKKLEHPNIVKYYNYLKEDENIYIIMEYLEGGTLKHYIQENSENINEDIARKIIKQLLSALSYLHYSCDICHRDIKPENIMFTEKNNIDCIKLLDFGLSLDAFESKMRNKNCGTLTYMAPEQISNFRYSKGVDVWSVGIVLYMLLNKGKNPFYNKGDTVNVLIENINNKNIEFDLEKCPISEFGRHLIFKLLDKNPSYRYTVRLALAHPWITLNKFDRIPMTLYDKMVEDENIVKLKMLLLISSFMLYYKKNYLTIKNNIDLNNDINDNNNNIYNKNFLFYSNNKEISKNNYNEIYFSNNINNLFNMNSYEKNIIKINKIYEKKFEENRENMFLPQFKSDKYLNIYLFKRHKNKIENKKNDEGENNNEKENNFDIQSDKENDNNSNDKEQKIENDNNINNKGPKNENDILKLFESNNNQSNTRSQIPHKSILKKNKSNISPTKIRINNKNNRFFNDQGMTPDINNHQKISNKLISFRLSIESKDIEHKNTYKTNNKPSMQKPIKLQSINNNNSSNNLELMGKSKSFKLMSKNNEMKNYNQNEIENSVISKSSKNIDRTKNEKKYSSKEKKNRNNISNKDSFSIDIKYKKKEINKKKLNYKTFKLKDEYDEIDKLNTNLFSTKSKLSSIKKSPSSYLTMIRKTRTGSIDTSQLIPKKLFQNTSSILPPIQNK